LIASLVAAISASGDAHADALARLKPERLAAVHEAVVALRSQWRKLERPGPYKDYRANLHVHSHLSHDSRGTIAEIVAAAKAAGTKILMFTEHPADHYDYFSDGHRGVKDGVLLIPGAETKGFLVFPRQSLRGLDSGSPQEFADVARNRGSMVFLSHLEERMDWDIRGLTGVEIYNTHADFKDEKNLQKAMRNPLWLLQAADLFRKYPQEAFSSLLDYPADYLKRWDELCGKAPHTGVAANDAHQNVGLIVRQLKGDNVQIEDALGKKWLELKAGALPFAQPANENKAGDIVYQLRLDPYENSLRHVGTHLLLAELSANAVWEALEAGRAFVSFDWLADATGFDCAVHSGGRRFEMGSRLEFADGLKLRAQAPLAVRWKLLRDGKPALETAGRVLNAAVQGPGRYRVEAWLRLAGEDMIWILSNPFYIKPR
jgi:hypothetical protein